MGKYQPLGEFLHRQTMGEIRLTFAQIENIIGMKLPPKAQHHRAWWSNSASNNVMTKAWLEAGFRSEQVDMDGRKLVFRRASGNGPQDDGPKGDSLTNGQPRRTGTHPLIGSLKGTVWIAPDLDLTQPVDHEWGDVAYGDKSWGGSK